MSPRHTARQTRHWWSLVAGIIVVTLMLSGCAQPSTPVQFTSQGAVSVVGGRAIKDPEFSVITVVGVLRNNTNAPLVVKSLYAGANVRTAIHERVDSEGVVQMRDVREGWTIPPLGEHSMATDGDHMMFWPKSLPNPGDRVRLYVELEDGDMVPFIVEVQAAPVPEPTEPTEPMEAPEPVDPAATPTPDVNETPTEAPLAETGAATGEE